MRLNQAKLNMLRRVTRDEVYVYLGGTAAPGNGISKPTLTALRHDRLVTLDDYIDGKGCLIRPTDFGWRLVELHAEATTPEGAAYRAMALGTVAHGDDPDGGTRALLAAYEQAVIERCAAHLEHIADETERHVAKSLGHGLGTGSAELVRESAASLRTLTPRPGL